MNKRSTRNNGMLTVVILILAIMIFGIKFIGEMTSTYDIETNLVVAEAVDGSNIDEASYYYEANDVALYLHTFGHLPPNYITKNQAKEKGWVADKGNLWDVAKGMVIGGDYYGNYEDKLADASGRKYYECDVNYEGGYRNAYRIVFSNDGLIYYTTDHYETFTRLY